jgi:Tol biopolymer transport system component
MTNIPLGNYQAIYCNLSPNAEKLYFVTYFPTNSLYIVNVNGSEMVEISDRQYFNYGTVKFSPRGNMIAYIEPSQYPNHRGTKLFISNTSGTYKKLLKDSIQDGGSVEWSNDGKKIIFHSFTMYWQAVKISVIDTSKNNFTELAEGIFPAWSPSGNKICFVNYIGTNRELWLMNPDGTNIVNISNTTTRDESNIKWSKDGMKILYNSYEPGQPSSIYIYDLNSNSNTLLADSVSDAIWQ